MTEIATPPSAHRPMTPMEWALLLAVSILWGSAYYFVAIAVKELPPLTTNMLRLALAVPVLIGALWASGGRLKLSGTLPLWFLGVGFLNNTAPIGLITWAQQYVPAGAAAILGAAMPIATIFIAHALTTDEKVSGRRLIGAVIGFIGVAIMIGVEIWSHTGLDFETLGELACLLAACFFALGTVLMRRFRGMGIAPLAAAAGTLSGSWLIFAVLALTIEKPWTLAMPSGAALLAIIGAGLLSSALAHLLFFKLLSTASANNAGLVTLLQPVVAILLGALLLGEHLQQRHLVGMSIIAIGLGIIDGRPLQGLNRWRQALSR